MIESTRLDGYYDKKEVTSEMTGSSEGRIDITDVEFAYPTKQDVKILDKINIDVETNQVVALVGQSGKYSTIGTTQPLTLDFV